MDIWCAAAADAGELIRAAEAALRIGARAVAIPAASVGIMWSWLENRKIEILAAISGGDFAAKNPESDGQRYAAERLTGQIQSVLKKGADGVILDAGGNLPKIVSALLPVRDDLFFGKKLIVALNLNAIKPLDWADIFHNLISIGADGVLFDARAAKSRKNVAGKIYGMLDNWDSGLKAQASFLSDNPGDMGDALRLAGKMKPDVAENMRFFAEYK